MKKKMRKVMGAVLLALAIAVTQVPASFVEAIGSSADFERDGDTLISYTGTASVVSVPDGIRTIRAEAFSNNETITSVTFPNSVESIGNGAFRNCPRLTAVRFTNGQIHVGSGAFSMCENLQTVILSDSVRELGAGVFSGDSRLRSIQLGENSNYVLQDGALYNSDRTTLYQVFAGRTAADFVMPDTVTDIERYAFWGCDNLRNVSLSASLTQIPEYAFSNCGQLETVSIPYSVRKIAAKAFEDCTSLGDITIPVSVTTIHDSAFDGCFQLHIIADEGTTAYEFAQTLEVSQAAQMEYEDSVSDNAVGNIYEGENENTQSSDETSVSENGEDSYDGSYDIDNPADVSDLDVSAYYANDSAEVIGKSRIVAGNAVIMMDASGSVAEGGQSQTDASSPSAENRDSERSNPAVIADSLNGTIANKAYYQDETISSIAIADGITSIDDFAFARSTLTSVSIPDSVSQIGYGAFYHCDSLQNISIPSSVTEIEPEAFSKTAFVENWRNGADMDDFLVVGDGILIAYKGTGTAVSIPGRVKKIAGSVFENRQELVSVALNENLEEIGEAAFMGCSNLSSVTGGKHVQKIADRAFWGCNLSQIHISNDVSEIGLGAYSQNAAQAVIFENTGSLPELSFEKTSTRLANEAYRVPALDGIETVVIDNANIPIEDTLLDADYSGFRGMVVTLPDGLGAASKTAYLQYCTLLPRSDTGLVSVPSAVQIDGSNYTIIGAASNAFRAYETYRDWADETLKGIVLPAALGSISDYEPALVFDSSESETTGMQEEAAYVVTTDLGAAYPNAAGITAEAIDDDSYYRLLVNQSQEEQTLAEAVSRTYGSLVDGQLLSFDLKMVERVSNIPISKFGKEQVQLRVPISETMWNQNICAVTLREDGSLETIYGTKETTDSTHYFVFRTTHFSAYGIYAGIGEVAEQIEQQSARLMAKDVSPDTGEAFNPKWLLAIGLLCAGLALLLHRPFRRAK